MFSIACRSHVWQFHVDGFGRGTVVVSRTRLSCSNLDTGMLDKGTVLLDGVLWSPVGLDLLLVVRISSLILWRRPQPHDRCNTFSNLGDKQTRRREPRSA